MRNDTSISARIFNFFNMAGFVLFTILCTFPFYYIIINTISNNREAQNGYVMFYPRGINFQNYINVLQLQGFPQAALVSVARTVIATVLVVVTNAYMGYAMTRREYWARKFWYKFIILTMYFGAGLIPGFLLIKALGMYDSFLVYVIPGLIGPFNIVLFKTFMETSIPASLEESAQMDGAGYMTRFTKIVFPLSMPIIATIALFTAVGQWNSYFDTVLYIRDSNLYTLQFRLWQYLNYAEMMAQQMRNRLAMGKFISQSELRDMVTPKSVRMTVTVVVVLPIMCVYPFLQRYFVKGIMIGAIKG